MVKISDIFEVKYGHSLELNRLVQVGYLKGIPFVSRVAGNNGISAFVEPIDGVDPSPSGELTCALGGNGVMSVFLQRLPYYSGRDIARLIPKISLTETQLLFYCYCLSHNKFRYSYGRQANKTLKSILIPSLDDIPEFVGKANAEKFVECDAPKVDIITPILDVTDWKQFRYDEIFDIKKGYYNKKPPIAIGEQEVPFIGATENKNGVTSFILSEDLKRYSRDGTINHEEPIERKLYPAKCITVSNNGSVGEAFYQPLPFTCSHDVNPLYLKDKSIELSPFLGLFLCTIIRADKYRWGYGRKWRPIRMPNSLINLPVTDKGNPDWQLMEDYIKSLPYSSSI